MKSKINFCTINKIVILFLILIHTGSCKSQTDNQKDIPIYAVAEINTPVLNTSDFESVFGGYSGTEVKLDSKGLIREMEFIALPGTAFEILEVIPKDGYSIYRVKTDDYPYYSTDIFIDSRFTKTSESLPAERSKKMPSKNEILSKILSLEGYPYMWGGNCGDGIEQLLEFYKPSQPADQLNGNTKDLWILKGVDCSGLIYEATNGCTPRNTSSLVTFGEGVDISGMNAHQIAAELQPLDLIVWGGHVIIVLDENTVIESTPGSGVHKSDLKGRLKIIMKERTPVNDWGSTKGNRFVVRRWAEYIQ